MSGMRYSSYRPAIANDGSSYSMAERRRKDSFFEMRLFDNMIRHMVPSLKSTCTISLSDIYEQNAITCLYSQAANLTRT